MRKTGEKGDIVRNGGRPNKRALFLVVAGALCLGAAFVAATLLISSCSASVISAIKADGGAHVTVQAEIPAPLAAKFRKLAAAGSQAPASAGPLFDAAAIRSSLGARPGISLVRLSQPSPDSIRVEFDARSLEDLAASADAKASKIVTITRGSLWTECRFRLERGDAKTISALLPGLDPYLMDALSPPALEEDPVSLAEYKTMLKSVLGEKVMPAMEAASIRLSVTAPGPVLASGGGSLSGPTLTATIPILEFLTLEKPIEIWLRWAKG
jgi:hypothetical protein